MVTFELSRLSDYSDEALLAELRRVASMTIGPLSRKLFDKYSKASASTYQHRFGGWRRALERVGLGDRYGGRTVSEKMRLQVARFLSDEELLGELRRCAETFSPITAESFTQNSSVSAAVIRRRFGSWNAALKRAGLSIARHGRRYTDDEYFENLLSVWTHLSRQPSYSEMNAHPSYITSGAYEKKWGTWRKALVAFLTKVSASGDAKETEQNTDQAAIAPAAMQNDRDPRRKVPLSIRFSVLKRDRFTCVFCGASPAKGSHHPLHVDHIIPWSQGGKTAIENLRTLCEACNLGRVHSAGVEHVP